MVSPLALVSFCSPYDTQKQNSTLTSIQKHFIMDLLESRYKNIIHTNFIHVCAYIVFIQKLSIEIHSIGGQQKKLDQHYFMPSKYFSEQAIIH